MSILEETKARGQENEASDVIVAEKTAMTVDDKPVLEYSEVSGFATSADLTPSGEAEIRPEAKPAALNEERYYAPPKKSRKGIFVLATLIIFAGLGAAAYSLGVFGNVIGLGLSGMENVTEPPENAEIPVFIPLDPAEFADAVEDELVVVPDETGLELSDGENTAETAAVSRNYYTQVPNVSEFYANAAQDESYIYFLKGGGSTGVHSDLMRMKISNGKTEPVPNANEVSMRIYSFALWRQNIITCEFNSEKNGFAFYRVPKSGEDAQLLFEHASYAIMNAYDNKIFMLFSKEGKLGIFDPETDTQPAFIDLLSDKTDTVCQPEFSVVDGYLYYGVMYDGENPENRYMRYLRRSLYTGEETVLLDSGEYGLHEIIYPCWDSAGNAYYKKDSYDESDSGTGDLTVQKSGGPPESFRIDGQYMTLLAITDEYLIAIPTHTIMESKYVLQKYSLDDFTLQLEAEIGRVPYSITKDYLISVDGVHKIFDFSFTAFDK